RAQPSEVERARHEAIRFCSLAEEAKLADSQLATAARRRRQVCEGCAPTVKPGLVEIRGVGACDRALEMRENPLLPVVAPAQGALVRQPCGDPLAQRCRGGFTHGRL